MQKNQFITLKTPQTLAATRNDWRTAGETIALVPTMGALHEGHLSLVELARKHASKVTASIFVNPMQFGKNEDFGKYPRLLAQDLAKLDKAGADAVYTPGVEEMYPPGFSTSVRVHGLSDGLCGAFRPDFFGGVATVVTKLLLQALPDIAVFGEKDYQQLLVVRQLVRDLDIPVKIISGPTVREADGLAMSSRNQYLSAQERQIAPQLYRELRGAAEHLRKGEEAAPILSGAIASLKASGFRAVDYLELRDAQTLESASRYKDRPLRLLAAAWLENTRLIDNVEIN